MIRVPPRSNRTDTLFPYTTLFRSMNEALLDCDLLLTTGGVSVGDHDLVRPVAEELGVREVFWQVAQKPGKPLYFGVRDDAGVRRLMLGDRKSTRLNSSH